MQRLQGWAENRCRGGCGALWYYDKTFTIATHQDQWLAVPLNLSPNNYTHTRTKAEMNTTTPIRYLSCFSGIEAASVAWEPLGFQAVGFSEIEPFPCAVLKHRFPHIPNYGDITKHPEWNIEPGTIDLLVGGSPCQAFSVAGLRKGLADPRGNLALTFLGLADRLRPKWILWENVPGVLSSSGGRDFGAFLGALGQLGYGWAYRILDAQHFGVPQRRRRVFLVATSLGDSRVAAEVLSLGEGLRGYLETRKQKGKSPAADAGSCLEADGPWWDGSDTASTLTKKGAGCQQRMPDKGNFEAVVQPKPIVIDRAAFNQGENYNMIAEPKSHWDGGHIHPTLNQSHNIGSPGYSNQELFSQGGGGLVPSQPIPYRKAKRAQSTTDDESWVEGEVSNTLNNFDLGDTRTTHAVVSPMAVRRLTPKECERLQGFPDDWTLIPWKGKPADQCPDGPRYKACGNSMAVPCMAWIGKRIAEVHARIYPAQ